MEKLNRIVAFLGKHKYSITILCFLVLIVFLDENNLLRRMGYEREIQELKREIEHYRKDYERDTKRLEELHSNPEAIEQIAREKYLMKKKDEDIFVFEQ